jgi:hypothetical protein
MIRTLSTYLSIKYLKDRGIYFNNSQQLMNGKFISEILAIYEANPHMKKPNVCGKGAKEGRRGLEHLARPQGPVPKVSPQY